MLLQLSIVQLNWSLIIIVHTLSAPILSHTAQTRSKRKRPHSLICQLSFHSYCFHTLSPVAYNFPVFWCLHITTLVHPIARRSEDLQGLIPLTCRRPGPDFWGKTSPVSIICIYFFFCNSNFKCGRFTKKPLYFCWEISIKQAVHLSQVKVYLKKSGHYGNVMKHRSSKSNSHILTFLIFFWQKSRNVRTASISVPEMAPARAGSTAVSSSFKDCQDY